GRVYGAGVDEDQVWRDVRDLRPGAEEREVQPGGDAEHRDKAQAEHPLQCAQHSISITSSGRQRLRAGREEYRCLPLHLCTRSHLYTWVALVGAALSRWREI